MDKSFLVTQSLRFAGLGLLLLGLAVACEEEPAKPSSSSGGSASSGGTGGTGGTSGTGGSLNGEGGQEEEVRKGERGSSCDASTDCEEGLSCIVTSNCPVGIACANKSCQPSNFDIMGTGKQCHVIDCATTTDCCGDMPLEAPAKCANVENICATPTLPGCTTNLSCTSDTSCGPGTCVGSTCSYDGAACDIDTGCDANTCDTSLNPDACTLTGADCSTTPCATVTNTCYAYCNCVNPDYDITDPICSDPDCAGICPYVCNDERCVQDTSCEVDLDCSALLTPFCDDSGACVECLTSDDCADEDEECVAGHCGAECEVDTQCALFETCQANECVFVGCQTDRECVLSATIDDPSVDPRLAKCSIKDGVGTCLFPCEIDAQCAPTEVCLAGVCEYIGCETDGECKTIAGLHNQPAPTDARPWVTTAECRAETAPAP